MGFTTWLFEGEKGEILSPGLYFRPQKYNDTPINLDYPPIDAPPASLLACKEIRQGSAGISASITPGFYGADRQGPERR